MNAATGALAPAQIAKMIDHALLRPELTSADVLDGCGLAARHDVGTVCVKPVDVAIAHDALADTDVLVGTVIAFPHGSLSGAMKAAEAEHALENGARELDMVSTSGACARESTTWSRPRSRRSSPLPEERRSR